MFKDGKPNSAAYDKLEAIRDILTTGGRSLVQGALAWLWAKSDVTIPIPGFKSVEQIKENAKAMDFGLSYNPLLGRLVKLHMRITW